MRIDPRSVSPQPRGWGPATDAPTFLPQDEVVLPLRAPKSDSVITSAPKTQKRALPEARVVSRGASQSTIKPGKQERVAKQERSSSPHVAQVLAQNPQLAAYPQLAAQLVGAPAELVQHIAGNPQLAQHLAANPPLVQQLLAQVAAQLAQQAQQAPAAQPAQRKSAPQVAPQQVAPQQVAPQQVAPQQIAPQHPFAAHPQGEIVPPFIQFEGGASFDPLQIPLAPELAPPVYGWLRRLALQADLAGADRLLREALADLTSALNVLIIYASPDGLHSVGVNDELPNDMEPIIAVAKSRRALVGTHSALIPITTSTETIAVIQLVRNVRQVAFNMVDHVTMAALARESASIMHHLVVEHLQRRTENEADKKSLYRPEALEQHRKKGQEGVLTELSPGWVKATYKFLLGAVFVAILFAFFVKVPTYSTGVAVVVYPGTPISAPAPGQVDQVYVQAQTEVRKGDALVKLKSETEESAHRQAKTELEAALQSYLFDPSDETIRKALVSAQAAAKRAEDSIAQRTIRATRDGIVSDIHTLEGKTVNFGDPILTIVAPDTLPEMYAFMPGGDRPRFKAGQNLQVALDKFQKVREKAKIYDIALGNTGAAMARNLLGAELADSLKLDQGASYVLVKAKLPKQTFRAKGKKYNYYTGIVAKVEVKVESKRFLTTLLPSLEKYTE